MAAGLMFGDVLTHAPGRLLFAASELRAAKLLPRMEHKADLRISGRYRLVGTTAVSGTPDVPVSRRVRLYHEVMAAICASELWSAADGSYVFDGIDRGPWTVIAFDHTGEYNAVVASGRYGEPM